MRTTPCSCGRRFRSPRAQRRPAQAARQIRRWVRGVSQWRQSRRGQCAACSGMEFGSDGGTRRHGRRRVRRVRHFAAPRIVASRWERAGDPRPQPRLGQLRHVAPAGAGGGNDPNGFRQHRHRWADGDDRRHGLDQRPRDSRPGAIGAASAFVAQCLPGRRRSRSSSARTR